MPNFVAKKLCPDIIFIPCHFEKYKSVSNIFMSILKKYDDNLESMGLDEANLDLTQYINDSNEDPGILCQNILKDVFLATQLTASCGIGPNKMIAKLASEINKPNGMHVIQQTPSAVLNFLENLPVRKITGIGNITEQILSGLHFNTCMDVRDRADELYLLSLLPRLLNIYSIHVGVWLEIIMQNLKISLVQVVKELFHAQVLKENLKKKLIILQKNQQKIYNRKKKQEIILL